MPSLVLTAPSQQPAPRCQVITQSMQFVNIRKFNTTENTASSYYSSVPSRSNFYSAASSACLQTTVPCLEHPSQTSARLEPYSSSYRYQVQESKKCMCSQLLVRLCCQTDLGLLQAKALILALYSNNKSYVLSVKKYHQADSYILIIRTASSTTSIVSLRVHHRLTPVLL